MKKIEPQPMNPIMSDAELADSKVLYFNPKEIGLETVELQTNLIHIDGHKVYLHWFHNPKGVDLYFWEAEKKDIIKQQLIFMGQVVEWNIVDGVKTGYILEEENPSPTKELDEFIVYDGFLKKAQLQQALDIMKYMDIESERMDRLSYNFKEGWEISQMLPKEVLKRYGFYRTKIHQKVRRWIRSLFGTKRSRKN